MPGMHDEAAECFLHDGREPMECGQLLVDVQCRLLEIQHHMPGMHDQAAQCFLHDGWEPGECTNSSGFMRGMALSAAHARATCCSGSSNKHSTPHSSA